jgi:hypothetical protein
MKKFPLKITPNEFFTTNNQSVLLSVLSKYPLDVKYGYIFLGYPKWGDETVDIFQYLDVEFLNSLKNNLTILIVDYTYEGFSKYLCPIIKILENNCINYGIDPKRIFYFSGNLKDQSETINTIPMFILDNKHSWSHWINSDRTLESAKAECIKNLEDKIFLSLSRRNRYHRVIGHLLLSNSPIFNYGIISQDTIKEIGFSNTTIKNLGLSEKAIKRFRKTLPLIADKNNFNINDPFNILSTLHTSTVFSIVNETIADDYDNTSLFYSEKILKPIINFQPMIIFGQPGINHELTRLGFKTYDKYFDLSFDYEPDMFLRYRGILNSINKLVLDLSTMSKQEKIDWRFKHQEILEHNYQVFLNTLHSEKQSQLFFELVRKLPGAEKI